MSTKSILIADDDPLIRELIGYAIGLNRGWSCIQARDGHEAVRALETCAIDALVTDINMPGPDGVQVCNKLRSRPEGKGIPVIVISAMADDEYVGRAMAAGANAFIGKPFSPSDLLQRLEALMTDAVAAAR